MPADFYLDTQRAKKETGMPSPFPNLVACDMRYMQISFHVSGGLEDLDAFWEHRGLDRQEARLVFLGYKSGNHPHTLSIRWVRSHADCCDVYITVEARRPENVLQTRSKPEGKEWMKRHRITQGDLQAFMALIRGMELPQRITARFAFPWKSGADSILRISSPEIRPTSFSFDLTDEKGRVVLRITHQKEGKGWLLIVEPTWRFGSDGKDLLGEVYETGCSFARELGGISQ